MLQITNDLVDRRTSKFLFFCNFFLFFKCAIEWICDSCVLFYYSFVFIQYSSINSNDFWFSIKMMLSSLHCLIRPFHLQWRSSVSRTLVILHRRSLATTTNEKRKDSLVESTSNTQVEVATFKEKGEKFFFQTKSNRFF